LAARLFPKSHPAEKPVDAAKATPQPAAPAAQATAPSSTQESKPAASLVTGKPATETAKTGTEDKTPAAEAVYKINAPEGSEIDSKVLSAYESAAKELGLPNEAAQNLINRITPMMKETADAQVQAVRSAWVQSSEADPEFGGDKLKPSLETAKRALDSFGSPAFKELLESSGLGSHPEMIRLLWKAGKAISEDSFVGGQRTAKQSAGPRTFSDMAEALYAPRN
jgi:hypothetical protein